MIYLGNTPIDATSSEYAKKEWVQNQGYLTEVPSTVADKNYVDGSIGALNTSINSAINDINSSLGIKYNGAVKLAVFDEGNIASLLSLPLNDGIKDEPNGTVNHDSDGYVVVCSSSNTTYTEYPYTSQATRDYVASQLSGKQDTLVSGTNIKTVNNQSILGEGNLTIDLTIYRVVQSLPSQDIDPNKIYLMLNPEGAGNNAYDEYMYVNNAWEKIGQMGNNIDLTGYLTIADASLNFATKASLADYVQTSNLDTAVSGLNYVKSSVLSDYLLSSTASQTYLTIADASTTYVKDASLDSKVTALGYAKTTAIPTAYSDLTNDKGYKAIVLCTEAEYAAMVSAGTVDADTVYLTH